MPDLYAGMGWMTDDHDPSQFPIEVIETPIHPQPQGL